MPTKYRNIKFEADGVKWDSRREYKRWLALRAAEEQGLIHNLERQPAYELLPKITEHYTKRLKTKTKQCERTVQLPVSYTADFRYTKGGVTVVEDVKISPRMLPKEFRLKEKMFRFRYGFPVTRIFKPTDPI